MMTPFWLLVACMVAAALFVVLRPLLARTTVRDTLQNDPVLDIYHARLQEMDTEVASGVLSSVEREAARAELVRTLLQEAGTGGEQHAGISGVKTPDWRSAAALAILIPVVAVSIYLTLGNSDLAEGPLMQHADFSGEAAAQMASIEAMVGRLAKRLEQKPDDPRGWMMLVNSYMTLGRYAEALVAVERLYQITGDHPDVLVRYADVLATVNAGRMAGRPAELVRQALTLDPEHVTGLWLAGVTARETGNPAAAIDYWQRLLPHLKDDQASQQEVAELIAREREQLANRPEAPMK